MRTLVLLTLSLFMMLSFQNCGQPSNLELDSNLYGAGGATEPEPEFRVRIQPGAEKAKCFQDHLQLTGLCLVPESDQALIHFTIARDGQPISWGGGVTRITSRCDSGTFMVIIPKPVWSGFVGNREQNRFQLLSDLQIQRPGSLTFESVARESRNIFFDGNSAVECSAQ